MPGLPGATAPVETVVDADDDLAAPDPRAHRGITPPGRGLDAVAHRVLDQRLQQQRRHAGRAAAGSRSQVTRRRSPKRICSIAM